MRRSRYLVTGAAGFIAFHLIERLLHEGAEVVGIDNLDPFYSVALKQANLKDLRRTALKTGASFTFCQMDICELTEDSLQGQKFDAVIHLAAKAGVRPSLIDPEGYNRANVLGTLKVLEFCKSRGIKRLIFGSSSSVYGNDTEVPFREDASCSMPISPYAATKRAAELYCHTYSHLYGLRIASLRFFTVYGPRQRPDLAIHKFSRLIWDEKPLPFYGNGSTSRDYTHVGDIVQGISGAIMWTARARDGTHEIFNLGGSKVTSLRELVELLEVSLGVKANIDKQPGQPGDVERTFADVSKAKQVLGYSPQTAIEVGIRDFAKWFMEIQPGRKKAA